MINCGYQRCINKLAHYEDLEDQGRLLELPCKVGDTVYEVGTDCNGKLYMCPYEVQDISERQIMYCDEWIDLKENKDNIFFTYEAAEAKLKELRGEK